MTCDHTLYSLMQVLRIGSMPQAAMARRAGLWGVDPSRTSTARAKRAAQMTCLHYKAWRCQNRPL